MPAHAESRTPSRKERRALSRQTSRREAHRGGESAPNDGSTEQPQEPLPLPSGHQRLAPVGTLRVLKP